MTRNTRKSEEFCFESFENGGNKQKMSASEKLCLRREFLISDAKEK